MEAREMTFGERACGMSFNPGGREDVELIKRKFAEVVDMLNVHRIDANPEVGRMLSIAITETQTAQMWAVKAITWNK
jgi:hypothetical protein